MSFQFEAFAPLLVLLKLGFRDNFQLLRDEGRVNGAHDQPNNWGPCLSQTDAGRRCDGCKELQQSRLNQFPKMDLPARTIDQRFALGPFFLRFSMGPRSSCRKRNADMCKSGKTALVILVAGLRVASLTQN